MDLRAGSMLSKPPALGRDSPPGGSCSRRGCWAARIPPAGYVELSWAQGEGKPPFSGRRWQEAGGRVWGLVACLAQGPALFVGGCRPWGCQPPSEITWAKHSDLLQAGKSLGAGRSGEGKGERVAGERVAPGASRAAAPAASRTRRPSSSPVLPGFVPLRFFCRSEPPPHPGSLPVRGARARPAPMGRCCLQHPKKGGREFAHGAGSASPAPAEAVSPGRRRAQPSRGWMRPFQPLWKGRSQQGQVPFVPRQAVALGRRARLGPREGVAHDFFPNYGLKGGFAFSQPPSPAFPLLAASEELEREGEFSRVPGSVLSTRRANKGALG